MIDYETFMEWVERIAPHELAEEWDHSGFQIHCGEESIERVLLCLDVTDATIREAKELSVDMIISHHPLIFDGIYSLNFSDPMGKKIQELIKSNISLYSAHMTYDKSNTGNTVQMAERLGLSGFPLSGKASGEDEDFSVLVAQLKRPLSLDQLVEAVRTGLKVEANEIRLVISNQLPITKVGLCAGSGGDYLQQMIQEECQVYITGDVKYHLAMDAKESGITLIDPGHFGTEKFFASDFEKQLSALAGSDVEILISKFDLNPFTA
jgi:dinuclear metal center YbgI/SA1388 family protein